MPNANRTEVRSYQVTPSVHGSLATAVDYQASVSPGRDPHRCLQRAWQCGHHHGCAQSELTARRRLGLAGWADAQSHRLRGQSRHRIRNRHAGSQLMPTPGLVVRANAGRESNNFSTQAQRANATWGAGADWSPSTNVRASGQLDHRFFGNGYRLSAEYRLPRSVFRFSSSRDVNDPSAQSSFGALATAYDLFYAQFAGIAPDPVKRDELVRSYLQFYGISATAQVATGFLPSAATLQRRTELSYALQGVRSNVVLTVSNSVSSRIDSLSAGVDDLSNTNLVRQRSYSFTLGHRLTPVTGLSLDLSRQDNSGDGTGQSNSLRTIRLNLTTSLGQRSTASLSARHVIFDSTTQPYTENALVATFGLQF
ncbi:MAG: TIGR03016 family PEP-CTERM system-associated outer membrane protein [Ideonella sp.]|nr:TIGR03016 family PEP-CTERM system-associated outer membrane protein [Ideonella sp.]